jgi:glycosyltransferase A (GT-A) superfamily protein (DUF2064 family)
MTRHLVIFARAPQIATLSRDPRWTVWLFVTPDKESRHTAWRGAVPPECVRPQGPGDLGRRMLLPCRTLPSGPVVLVGSDIPDMRPTHIARAFHLLGRRDLVFGPASDGGFWLIGSRRLRPMPRGIFANVRWSSAQTLADARANVPAAISIGEADTLDDVDTADDLRRFRLSVR